MSPFDGIAAYVHRDSDGDKIELRTAVTGIVFDIDVYQSQEGMVGMDFNHIPALIAWLQHVYQKNVLEAKEGK